MQRTVLATAATIVATVAYKSSGSSTTPALANESAIACNIDTPTPTSTR